MVNDTEIPFFSYEEIRNRADDFLRQYHPSREIPVPIEEIIEFQMNIDIFPIQGLHTILDIDGFTISDLSTIYVDDFVYKSRPGRYRFTLAHEVGHIVLHRNIYLMASFQNIQGWKDFINSISDKDHSWLEYHAYTFGGLVLVPGEHLTERTQYHIERIRKEDISLSENWDFAWDRIADQLAKDFEVSTQVIEKRLSKDKVMDRYRS
mgnify:CR=1 FL=1